MIETLTQWVSEYFVLGTLVFTRMSVLLIAIISLTSAIPKRIQLAIAVSLSVLLIPSVETNQTNNLPLASDIANLIIAVGREAMIGLLIGTSVQLLITGIQIGAEVTSSSGALQMAATTDADTGENIPSLSKFVGLMVIAVMFAAGGHRLIVNALLESFQELPPGSVSFHESMMSLVVEQLTVGMTAGIQIAAPVIAALLLTNLVTGLISRTLPQLNVLAVGLSVNALALLVVTAITIGSAGLIFQDELVQAAGKLSELW